MVQIVVAAAVVVQSPSHVRLFMTPWMIAHQASLSLTMSWNSLGKDIGVGSCSLLQGIFPTQGSNPGLPCYKQIQIPFS